MQSTIKFQELTNYLCENNPDFQEMGQCQNNETKIPKFKLPEPKKFNLTTDERVIRDIDKHPPLVIKDNNNSLQRLSKEQIYIDSVHHNNNLIISSFYSKEINRIITLDSYSDQFLVY